MHLGIVLGPADGNDGKDAPLLDAERLQLVVQRVKLADAALVDAAHHVEVEPGFLRRDGDGPQRAPISTRAATHPVVILSYSVEADGQGTHASPHQFAVHGFVVEPAVRYHAPAYAPLPDRTSHLRNVGPQQRFAARKDNREFGRALFYRNGIERPQEVFEGHIHVLARRHTVTAAVAAVQVATRGTLPEQIIQLVDLHFVGPEKAEQGIAEHLFGFGEFDLDKMMTQVGQDRIFHEIIRSGGFDAELGIGPLHNAEPDECLAFGIGYATGNPVEILSSLDPGADVYSFQRVARPGIYHFEWKRIVVKPFRRAVAGLENKKGRRQREALQQIVEPFHVMCVLAYNHKIHSGAKCCVRE